MGKLKSREYIFKDKTGDAFRFTSDVSVTVDGVFRCTVPEELNLVIENLLKAKAFPSVGFNPFTSAALYKGKPIKSYVAGKELHKCEELIKKAGEDFVVCDVKEELVIRYKVDTKTAYFKNSDGRIFPNGCDKEAGYADNSGKWCGTVTSNQVVNVYSVGFAAHPYLKTTYTRNSGVKVEYKHHSLYRDKDGPYWALLKGFNHISLGYNQFGHSRNDPSIKEIPYTEEAAKFMYETMLGLCYLSDRIETFFGDDQAVMQAIENQVPLMLNGGK